MVRSDPDGHAANASQEILKYRLRLDGGAEVLVAVG
jgi:hypothetical protein